MRRVPTSSPAARRGSRASWSCCGRGWCSRSGRSPGRRCSGCCARGAWSSRGPRRGSRTGRRSRSTERRRSLGAYHVSQQNTQTGRLTPAMFDAVLRRAIELARLTPRRALRPAFERRNRNAPWSRLGHSPGRTGVGGEPWHFRVVGLPSSLFRPLYGLSDRELAERGIEVKRRRRRPGLPLPGLAPGRAARAPGCCS